MTKPKKSLKKLAKKGSSSRKLASTRKPSRNVLIGKKPAQDLLIEFGTEELPPKNLKILSLNFTKAIEEKLKAAELKFETLKSYSTPRRLAVLVSKLDYAQAEREVVKRGPAQKAGLDENGNPSKALLGFAESCGVKVSDLKIEETEKGAWYVLRQKEKGKTVFDLVPNMVTDVIKTLPLPKRMRWGTKDSAETEKEISEKISFVRPAHWIVLMYGTSLIKGEFLGLNSDLKTRGHRFLNKGPFLISAPQNYEKILEKGFVIPDAEKRKAKILKEINSLSQKTSIKVMIEENLLDEVVALVEWPVVLLGTFDKRFLSIPKEALIASMQVHQKCFPVENKKGELLNQFIIVSNIKSKNPKAVIEGNEAVMKARLEDAAFYYEKDQENSLDGEVEALKHVTFLQAPAEKKTKNTKVNRLLENDKEEKESSIFENANKYGLGSLYDKTMRVKKLARTIAEKMKVSQKDLENVERAAFLCKADLLSHMVNEFPELQGIMGRDYALKNKENEEAAWAIQEHYHPRFANDTLPASKTGQAIALADRIDSLLCITILNDLPKGDKDFFGLRRMAMGISRILIEKSLNLDLKELFYYSFEYIRETLVGLAERLVDIDYIKDDKTKKPIKEKIEEYIKKGIESVRNTTLDEKTVDQLCEFTFERLRAYYQEKDIPTTLFDAVLAIQKTNPLDFDRRIMAVNAFRKLPEGESLAAANKRVKNILSKSMPSNDANNLKNEELTANSNPKTQVNEPSNNELNINESLLTEPAEIALYKALNEKEKTIQPLIQTQKYTEALKALSSLKEPIDLFFDKVMVMTEDLKLRENRISLVKKLRMLFLEISDISLI